MNLWPLLGVLLILSTFTGFVWIIATFPIIGAILLVVAIALALLAWARPPLPSPFGACVPDVQPSLCGHCDRRIEADDAIREVPGHLPMHERCARERMAVQV